MYKNKEWLKEQFDKYGTVTEVSRQTGYPRTNISRYAKKYELYTPKKRNSKIKVNKDYFKEINTSDKAYFLGFIMADGYMYKRTENLYRFGLKIKSSDDDIIKKLCTYIDYPLEKIVYRNQERNGTISELVEIQINDQTFCSHLINLGIIPKKSGKEIMPNCNGYEIDFIRGFIDGDGWVYRHSCSTGQDRFAIGCCSSSLSILESIQVYIKDNLNIDMHISERLGVYKCENASKYKVFKLLNRIYYDNCLSLDRKNKIAQEIRKEIYDELF